MTMMLYTVGVALLLFDLGASVKAATDVCYNPDGTQNLNSAFQPCRPSDNVTHCCRKGETCLKNGLCLVQNTTSLNSGLCTDSTWQDQSCFPRCLVPARRSGPSTVYRCSNSLWCCSDGVANSTSCCQDEAVSLFPIIAHAAVENGSAFLSGYSIAPLESIITNGVAPTATPTQTMTFTTDISGSPLTITVTTAGNPTAVPVREVADAAAVLTTGLGTGLGVGVPLLAIVGVLSFLLFREKRRHRATKDSLSNADGYGYPLVTQSQKNPIDPYQSAPEDWVDQSQYVRHHHADPDPSRSFVRRIEADSREKSSPRPELPGS
ncbi:hypothetical protein PV04_02194 [Phialophora macrospora]|uniref:Mid2 domain-containing protein n=1 Tax=Phialophora macrospora TaxID=1851006 RepID=A0A0D2GCN8_9EURO|nr:hypothetical protein PV04_02194 [Phialophora macrospora]